MRGREDNCCSRGTGGRKLFWCRHERRVNTVRLWHTVCHGGDCYG